MKARTGLRLGSRAGRFSCQSRLERLQPELSSQRPV